MANCLTGIEDLSGLEGASISLQEGVTNINVASVERTFQGNESCSDGESSSGTATSNYTTGVTTISGTLNGQSLSCTQTYTTPLPTTISNPEEIADLLFDWGLDSDRSDFISSTCPDDYDDYDDYDDDDFDDEATCTGDTLYNITVTDEAGKKHRVSGKVNYTDL